MQTADTDDLMRDILASVFKPRTLLNTHEWCRKHVRLDSRFTARPGMFDVDFTPYMRKPYEWFNDPFVEEITGCKSRQVGGTTYLANCMMYVIGEDPGPVLYVTSTLDNAQSFSEREWQPRIDLSPLLSSLKPDDPNDFKIKEQHFKTCTAKFTGSNSPSNLMSRAIRFLFEDEVDVWPEDNGAEAPSIEIVEACTLSYAHARKILRISTPTVPSGAIWTNFLRGTQHKYHVPCPHCRGQPFELKFEQLNFHRDECRDEQGRWNLDRVRDRTTLKCPHCKTDIHQHQQATMVARGDWIQTNPDAPKRHISWHISALYSSTITWGQIAVLFLQKSKTAGGLHDFWNHYLGLPFTRDATTITISDVEKVRDISPSYRLFDPKNPKWRLRSDTQFILMAVDVQQDGFWWAKRGVCVDGSSYLIDYGQASHWDDLTELNDRWYVREDGERMQSIRGLIDCGYKAKRAGGVYEFCIKSGGRFWPCQGRSSVHGLYQPIRETVFEHKGHLIQGLQLRDDLYKEKLYIQKIKEHGTPGWWLPQNIDQTYKEQLSDERLEPKKNERGTIVLEWRDNNNNHLGDVEKYLLAGIDLVTPLLDGNPEEAKGAKSDEEDEDDEETELESTWTENPRDPLGSLF